MFFVAFFWAFFHSALAPVPEIGGVWPPYKFPVMDPWKIPLLNTAYLLGSGFYLTWLHCEIRNNTLRLPKVIGIYIRKWYMLYQYISGYRIFSRVLVADEIKSNKPIN